MGISIRNSSQASYEMVAVAATPRNQRTREICTSNQPANSATAWRDQEGPLIPSS